MDFGTAGSRNGTPSTGKRSHNIRDSRNLTKRVLLAGDRGDTPAYPAALNLYPVPPTQDISLELFEDLAVQRLRVRSSSILCIKIIKIYFFTCLYL